ncbi:hypothetical protein [Neobacillus cucumis]|uniref:hypothetical protein n=1 Tax=Neobacillus cucumis TaxID=1740721 RepID=UPI00285310E3|nr:hypothetical protein [Neobacillus cucumis]MDR4950010.1 hypothetical protein [Neobacillus cucumis]
MDEQNKLKTKLNLEANKNGSMAQDFNEVKKLGKEMNSAKTGSELKQEDNKTSDPLQSE